MKIDNGPEKAVTGGKWSRERGKELYGAIANETNRDELGREGFLIFPDDAFKLWPRASGLNRCKYPHHQVRNGELVVSIPGLRAAYARAKQQKVYSGELKAHLDRHFIELGLAHRSGDELIVEDAQLITESTIANNFDEIETFIERKQMEAVTKVEKVLLDLFNLVDQDLNLITLIDTVYLKQHIYESGEVITPDGEIRPVNTEDLDHIIPWLLTTNEFSDDQAVTLETFDRGMFVNDERWGNSVYGYDVDGLIEGFIRGKLHERSDGDYMAMSFLFVNPKFQGKGIGERLLEHMIAKYGTSAPMRLNVFTDNDAAIGLYRSHGFYTEDIQIIKKLEGENPKFLGKSVYKMIRPVKIGPDDYDPPLPVSQLPEHLRSDEIHLWRAITGIELIHREPTQAELDRIWHNWERMTDRQKTLSDEASRKFFGRSNSRHLADLRAEASGSESYRESSEPSGDDADKLDAPAEVDESATATNEEPEKSKPPEKESRPKQVDRAEAPKNGVKRKELYLAFIEYAKRINPKNTFGSVFDKDAFKVTYPFVPEEMRYFYRLANPLLCLLEDGLVLFSLADLRKVNTDNPKPDRWLIFGADRATDPNAQVVYAFNRNDKGIYCLDEGSVASDDTIGEPAGDHGSKVGQVADSFDHYLEHLAGVRVL